MDDTLTQLLLDLKANRISKAEFKAAVAGRTRQPAPDLVRLVPAWEPATAGSAVPGHVVLLAGPHAEATAIRATVHLLDSPAAGIGERYPDLACRMLDLLRPLLADPALPRTLVQLVCTADGDDFLVSGLAGMLRTAALEHPRIVPQLVLVDPDRAAEQIHRARDHVGSATLRFRDGEPETLTWRELPAPEPAALPWKEGGTYIITGGLGGLGLIFARDLLRSVRNATLVLTGRSPLDAAKQRVLDSLSRPYADVRYMPLDVADAAGVDALVSGLGAVDGILHSAGINRDGFLRAKTPDEVRAVLAPKVAGTLNLDHATRDLALDFFALFSSGAAVTGNVGQADYAAANAFLDAFAQHRDRRAAAGERSGRSLSVNWPLWADGGMTVDAETARALRDDVGMTPLRTESGVAVLHEFLLAAHSRVLVVEGDGDRIRHAYTEREAVAPVPAAAVPAAADPGLLRERVTARLVRLLGEVTGLSAAKIDPAATLASYGIDSLVVARLNRKLAQTFSGLSAGLLYEYNSLESLAGYFLTEHPAECLEWTGLDAVRSVSEAPASVAKPAPVRPARHSGDDAIAIIGVSGRFPRARNLDEFWRNLAAGVDCVSEIPAERWGLTGFYHPDRDEAVARGLSYSKWGGFLEGFADFDPLFFSISPHEAMSMDPQERLFLQESWNAVEDAGYTRQSLAERHDRRVGVFAGVSKTGFELYGPDLWKQNENLHPVTSFAAVANRVSYVLDLKGPSLAMDTMCSSSLTAVHEAMEHLRRGDCDAALAGGVNLYAHPASYVLMSRVRMLSDDGRCRSFGAGGTGFVPGEGVAVLLLKRLADAERDGDVIHAVLRGSSINHGGRTHGYTVPNPASQAEVVRQAMDRAGVSARDVSYVETHGTGTSLGDPIEVSGLSRAYTADTGARQFCAIGSAKSNIGHLEAAAGVAGLVKVLLQMRHGKLTPSLHSGDLNPEIDFGRTPFRVQRDLVDWERPAAGRIAGVSSFGAGGSNVHVVVAEHDTAGPAGADAGPQVLVLSAKDRDRLRERARELADRLGRADLARLHLADVAYTLQVGREAMESRLALRAESIAEAARKLAAFAAGADDVEDLYLADVKLHRETLAALTTDADMAATVAAWVAKGKLDKLMDLWVKGLSFDWESLWRNGSPRRVSLPGYPFARERYWVGDVATATAPAAGAAMLHPLVHVNASTLAVQRFESAFTGAEFFLRDHVVQGERVLPGVAYVEMVRAAVAASVDDGVAGLRLRNVVWTRPIKVTGEPVRVRTTLEAGAGDAVEFTVTTDADVVHSRGTALPCGSGTVGPVGLSAIRAACTDAHWDAERCYGTYRSMGLEYGPAHRGLESVAVGEGQALARLRLPAEVTDSLADFIVHPGLMDAALQASIGLLADDGGALYLPYAVEQVEILAPFQAAMWAWVRHSADDRSGSGVRKLDIDVCDDDGVVSCRFTGFSTRAYGGDAAPAPRVAQPAAPRAETDSLDDRVGDYLAAMLATELRMPADRIEHGDAFEVYGIDSIMTMNLTGKLEKVFGSLPKTLFFEYRTLSELAGYFLSAHEARLGELLGAPQEQASEEVRPVVRPKRAARPRPEQRLAVTDRIAVVGVAGRYPGAADLREFWRNLLAGRDSVTEIPADRWDHARYYDADPDATGRTYAKWGGFLDGADRFDALFFNISPREAEFMDPQERLFLECVQETFEDAGYTRETLSALDGSAGVFVGVMYEEYQLYGAEEQARGRNVALSGNPSSIANRASYFFDLNGPSMAVDTMCSSSLTAIHLACQSLLNGECEVAVAGGVNLSLHPNKYLMLGSGKWASSNGRCESFGAGGDGYVPGEGVGAVLLKPLARAEADGDTIHGVIRGTAVNHGGKTNGYSVPNPRAQAALIGRALRRAGVDARHVSYLEAHGTGTSLGDPIEIAGLTKAFREHTGDTQFCAIGSVKSNIGHAESAAGIAGLTKTLLQMRHGTLVPSLHSETLNPHIDFAGSPFRVQRTRAEWTPPRLADGTELPRIAGISSFGAGGSNAHVIVEEYAAAPPAPAPEEPEAIVLSARTEPALRDRAVQLLDWLERDGADVPMADLAYTLLTARDAFEERLGVVAATVADLTTALSGFLAGNDVPGLHRGRVKRRGGHEARPAVTADADHGELLELWVTGAAINPARFGEPGTRRRISLPTYPFQRERYWPTLSDSPAAGAARLHPLVHTNTSSLAGQRFSSVFTGDEFFLRDHRVRGERVLSGAACLELVRAAVALSLDGEPHGTLRLRNVAWSRPVVVGGQPETVHVRLRPGDGDDIAFEIAGAVVHSEGVVSVPPPGRESAPETLDPAALRSACGLSELSAEQVYAGFDTHAISYGPGHRGIERLWIGDGQVLARLVLPDAVGGTLDAYGLHPALLDSALQAVVGITTTGDDDTPHLPFAVDEVEIAGDCARTMWAWVRTTGPRRLDIDLCDDTGTVAVRLKGVTLRTAAVPETTGHVLAAPYWAAEAIPDGARTGAVALVIGLPEVADAVDARTAIRLDADTPYADAALRLFGVLRGLLAERTTEPAHVRVVAPTGADWAGLAGLLRVATLENPRVTGQVILVGPGADPRRIAADPTGDVLVRHRDGTREVQRWRELPAAAAPVPWKDGGVYLITGGAGGLGVLFARDIATRVRNPRIVLTGRSPARDAILAELRATGADVSYERVDVADRDAVVALVRRIRDRHGRLDGVLHSAGVIRDNFVLRKTDEEFGAVLAPKVAGALHLDEATHDAGLDFLVFFSSSAGAFGNVGQADYATANAFLDAFAVRRNDLVARGERRGRTLSVNWPLWAEGGMTVSEATERAMRENLGLVPLPTRTGIRALHRALATGESQVLVLAGEPARLAALFEKTPAAPAETTPDEASPDAVAYFMKLLSKVINLPPARIDPEASLEDYGIDSVMTMELTRSLEAVFGSLSKTLFFEYQSIEELAGYFVGVYPEKMRELVAGPRTAPATVPARRETRRESARKPAPAGTDIAIIGVAGRYPQARTVDEFWANLAAGKDCVTEIPADRWDHDRWYDPDRREPGTTYSKWGGFLDGAYDFDPLFFNISPREAEVMDPQERLFLQCVHETLEDAGYVRESVRSKHGNVLAGRVGVFVGVMYEDYQLHGAQSQVLGGDPLAVGGSPAAIANRVSYWCNFRGPSMSVDTMCSSSLTSIHLACRSIRWGDCDVAVAGGVNLSLHPNKYLLLSMGNFVSSTGRCHSFGAGGDGYTPGEGVGAVLLKPLAQAIADGDRIHGVIKGTALNHGGKTNGYTVPNPNAQAGVIADALTAAGLGARQISYLEAHGTGTSLGDPIEITGLSKAFRDHTPDHQFCAIGSVKSNIGHAESSAGIAGVTKVLMQLKHGKLAPSLHAAELNPHIDFAATPFTVQRELADWETGGTPRIAGISSFGAGGSNAHVIIAEYLPEPAERPAEGPAVVPLSARTDAELRAVAGNLADWLTRPEHVDLALADVAWTLQIGREPLPERLGLLATSVPDLVGKLRDFLAGTETEDMVRSTARATDAVSGLFAADADLDTLIASWAAKGKHGKLLELWVNEAPLDWRRLYPDGAAPRRVALPAYPFARDRYFPFEHQEPGLRRLHPLVHENTSDLTEQRFTSVFTGHEPFLRDHVVRGVKLMPGAALLEMAVAAASLTCHAPAPLALQNVVLGRPLAVDGPREVHAGLLPAADGGLRFRVYTAAADTEPVVHAEGDVYFTDDAAEDVLDLESLRAACDGTQISAERCYAVFAAAGIAYGPAHRAIRHLWTGPDLALAQLALPAAAHGDYTLHPSLLDAAIQASLGVLGGDGGLLVPFAIDDVLVLDACTAGMWAVLRPSVDHSGDTGIRTIDVDLADNQGRIRVRLGGLSFRALPGRPERQLLHPRWQARPVTGGLVDTPGTVLLAELSDVAALLPRAVVLTSGDKEIDRRFTAYGLQTLEHVRSALRGASTTPATIQLAIAGDPESAPLAGLAGLLRSAMLENPNLAAQLIVLDETDTAATAADRIREDRAHLGDALVRYRHGRREVLAWIAEDDTGGVPPVPWKEHGVYLLTGGTGALGLVFAREIAARARHATLILAGRSPLSAEKQLELNSLGVAAHYARVDVADAAAVDSLIDGIIERHGRLDGVLHGAGVTRDGYLLTKRAGDFVDVLAPKVSGVVNVDRATRTLPLDFFVAFSSTSGAYGNAGQADYAAANAFLDAYAAHRADLMARGERFGRSLSVNWPLWAAGGMTVTPEVEAMLRDRYGVVPLDTATGVAAFHRMLHTPHSQVLVAPGPERTIPLVSSAAGTDQ